jgi:hypothetical protein
VPLPHVRTEGMTTSHPPPPSPPDAEKSLPTKAKPANREHYYDLLLETLERLFDGQVETHVFEEQLRVMFGVQVCQFLNFLLKVFSN